MQAVTLHYRRYGQGEPVLILHGLFGSNRNWSGIAQRLAEQYHVITVDLRNHGGSGHADSMTYAEMAGDITGILRQCRLERAHLVGHSLGGKVAMVCALLHRSCIDDLIVLDIAPVAYDSRLQPLVAAMARLPVADISSRRQADHLLAREIPDDALRRFLLQNLVRGDEGYHWRINLEVINSCLGVIADFPQLDAEAVFPGRALFLYGKDSHYVRSKHHPVIRRYFPNAGIHAVADAGHWLHADQPAVVLDRIRKFLAAGSGPA